MKTLVSAALFTFVLFALGCAKPTYIDQKEQPHQPQGNQNSAQKATCGAQFKNSGLCLDWRWVLQPTDESEGRLVLKTYRLNVYDQTFVPVDTKTVPQLVLWMPGMGHGSTPTESSRKDVGTYEIDHVFFIMPGEWELRFQIKNGNAIEDEAVIGISI